GRWRGRPGAMIERLARRRDSAIHVVLARFGDARDNFLGVRVDDLELAAARRRDPLAADEELVGMPDVHACGGHWESPLSSNVVIALATTRHGVLLLQKLDKIVRLRLSSGLPSR